MGMVPAPLPSRNPPGLSAYEARHIAKQVAWDEIDPPGASPSWECYVDSVQLREVGGVLTYRIVLRWHLRPAMFRQEEWRPFTVDLDAASGMVVGIADGRRR